MRWHLESDNLCLLTVLLEFDRVVALMTVNYQHPIHALGASLCMLVKVLQPLKPILVICLAVGANTNKPILYASRVIVLGIDVLLALKNDEGWKRPPCCANRIDDC